MKGRKRKGCERWNGCGLLLLPVEARKLRGAGLFPQRQLPVELRELPGVRCLRFRYLLFFSMRFFFRTQNNKFSKSEK